MSFLSKLWNKIFIPEWSFKYNCYECAHPWTYHCSVAVVGIAAHSLKEGIKMYSALNLLNFIASRRYTAKAVRQNLVNVLNSSVFLSTNAFFIFSFFCGTRLVAGKFYYSITSVLPCFLGSYLAIFIERPARRAALTLYLVNIATECLFKVLVRAKRVKPIPQGEILLFALSMSILMYFNRTRGLSNDPISLVIRNLIGDNESRRGLKNTRTFTPKFLQVNNNKELTVSVVNKHPSCPHPDVSCYQYSLRNLFRSFGLSYGLLTLMSLLRRAPILFKDPATVQKIILNKRNIKFGLFLGAYTSVYRAINCFLRRKSNGPQDWHALLAGALAGSSMFLSPNSTVATYVTWKSIENSYCYGFSKGLLPDPTRVIPLLYAACVNTIFYCAVFWPDTVRPSYLKFLDTLSNHKIHLMNRSLLSVFRTGAEKGYEDYMPNLDLELCSNAFIETNLIWLL